MNTAIYGVSDIEHILKIYGTHIFTNDNKKQQYLNTPVSFDIETTSYYNAAGEKRACMYIWAFDIFDCTIFGRSWAEFLQLLDKLSNYYKLSKTRKIIIYVHNLAYEFQFVNKWLQWEKVFALDERKPAYAITESGFEFRCSYILSGCKLETLGKELKNKLEKQVGSLDYTLIRHPQTPITDDEKRYLLYDVKIVSEYIREKIAEENGICNIPLTKTGYVRRFCRARCIHDKKIGKMYREMISQLTLTSDEYTVAKDAFTGGFTHANFWYQGKTLYNVKSFDFSSSYPAVMIAEKFPMSKGEKIEQMTKAEFEYNLDNYCCIFLVELKNVRPIFLQDNPISESRCRKVVNGVINNGRVYSADLIRLTVTNIDFRIIQKCYTFEVTAFDHFYRYKAGYLPKPFIECILELYKNKTTLKGVPEKEDIYARSKADLNSLYGMCVTDICRDEIIYSDNTWYDPQPADPAEKIPKENTKHGRFLFYLWGVFVTAYARRNLWSGILECGVDYVYSDTDSIKILNAEKHMDFINRYNKWITARCEQTMKYYNLPISCTRPKTIKGKTKQIGVWELDGEYAEFKTLGAKRYLAKIKGIDKQYLEMYESWKMKNHKTNLKPYQIGENRYLLTVAGLPKDSIFFMLSVFGENHIFDKFNNDLVIAGEYTGKLTHTYIDTENNDTIIDYTGQIGHCCEKSFIHLSNAEYSLKISEMYKRFLHNVRDIRDDWG